jgi:receptor protein-tyrosine kinase
MMHDPYDPRCEAVRALRTELLLRRDPASERGDILALLSPCATEGRSMLAAELAIALSQLCRPTLLVDADLRHPRQHALFGTGIDPGLSQVLEHGAKPTLRSVQDLPWLSLVTAGAVPHNPLELLSSSRFASVIADWREKFEFVVIDTPPVTQFSDGLAVASIVGRVLALSRAHHTPYKNMRDMLLRLTATRSHLLGAVLGHF